MSVLISDVAATYDALGRQLTQSNGIATTTYAYDSSTLALDTETIAYNLDGNPGADFTRILDRSRDNLQRETGWELKGSAGVPPASFTDNQATYTYSPTDGRLASVSGGGLQPPSQFQYSYTPNSNLLATVTGPAHTVTNSWEATRNVLASKENKVDTTVISSYGYSVNSLGQRSNVAQAGSAFAATRNITWGYDQYGQVATADSDNSADDRAYQYDAIGNRLKSADSLTLPGTNNYTVNALNQYSAVDTINPGYDDDGNATAYPLPANPSSNSTLTWDAENRIISATVNSVTTTYFYDSQSRRIATTTGSAKTLNVYDGWNPIAEYSANILSKTYTWGMDLSGSMQGAGGVGGLLAVTDNVGSHFPTYDGNGNISEYLDAAGAIAAHYEYDPFGRETVSNGTNPAGFAHRFSTKPIDLTTGLLYYGYRYYDPETGRWPSRDPIEEEGGINLYGFVMNASINNLEVGGLFYGRGVDVENFVANELKKDDVPQAIKDFFKDKRTYGGHNDMKSHSQESKGCMRFEYTRPDWGVGKDPKGDRKGKNEWHFIEPAESKTKLEAAISECNLEEFEDRMHGMQDWYIHKDHMDNGHIEGVLYAERTKRRPQRYYEIPLPNTNLVYWLHPDIVPIGGILRGGANAPWDLADKATGEWVEKWEKNCCCKKGKWKKVSSKPKKN